MTRAGHAAIRSSVALFLSTSLPASQQSPTFRGGVELVAVDVVVLDKSGAPITNLLPSDFSVTTERRDRRVVSAEYLSAAPTRTSGTLPSTSRLPGPTTNDAPPAGRTLLFVVDTDEIRAGEGRVALGTIGDYLRTLRPDDRVGLVSLPIGSPRLDVTTEREPIVAALAGIVGSSSRTRACEMTPGEAEAVTLGNTEGTKAYVERTAGLRCPTGRFASPETLAGQALNRYRQHTQFVLDSLGQFAAGMTSIPGPKAIVLVSEGFLNDALTNDALRAFAATAERARVSLYAIHLDVPRVDATASSDALRSRGLDDRLGFDSMSELASATRGTALRALDNATAALGRIDAELAGYYLVSFERDASDRDGQRQTIAVKINRPDVDVRARKEFTPGAGKPIALRPGAAKTAMADLLRAPLSMGDVELAVDAYATPVAGNASQARVFIAADIQRDPKSVASLGYEVVDDTGRSIADAFESPPALRSSSGGRSIYSVSLPIAPGRYRLKLGAIDDTGRRGSVTHAFEVPTWPRTNLRVSDLMFGDAAGGGFRPLARLPAGASEITFRFEVMADSASAFNDVKAQLRVTRAGDSTTLDSFAVPLAESGDPLRRVTTAAVDLRAYTTGTYVMIIEIQNDGMTIARTRRFKK
jgi:VWFA-related protein